MMGVLNWFKKKEPEDYEEILSSLALDIQKRQQQLSDIRLREKRTTLLVTMYTFAVWTAYVAAWYSGFMPSFGSGKFDRAIKVFPVFLGPILIQLTRRIVQTWYTRKENNEEKTLKILLNQQRTKVEEIKKKTNYYTTKNLLDRYDSSPAESPLRQRPGVGQKLIPPPGTPQRPGQNMPNGGAPVGNATGVSPHVPQNPMSPGRKQWYDKLADALIGDDDLSMNSAANKYALICQKCFTHNGLVKEELWEDAQYVCPKCGYFNPSARSIKAGRSVSPTSPTSLDSGSHSAQPQSKPTKGRRSMPANLGQSHLQPSADVSGSDRRRSMPTRSGPLLDDEETQRSRKTSPLAKSFALPEDVAEEPDAEGSEEEGAEGNVSTESTKSTERTMLMEVDS